MQAGRLTCVLQRLEAPDHPRDAGVEAAPPIVALLGGDFGVATVHPVLGLHLAQVRRCTKRHPVSAEPAWPRVGLLTSVCQRAPRF